MGKAIIIRDGIAKDTQVNAQTLQAAYQNGLVSNAKGINTSDPFHANNQPHVVDTTSSDIPSDLRWGIREVFFKANGTAVISITGIDTNGAATLWFATVTKSSNVVTFGDWVSIKSPTVFGGATSSTNGTTGIVPAPTTADTEKVLLGSGSWGYPRRTTPVASIARNTGTGAITITYIDNSSEILTQTDSTHYQVVEKNSSGTTIRTYVTAVDAAGNATVTITEGSGS